MNAVLKIFLSMSFSGGLLILALLLGKRFLKDKISRQWQYYIWLIVVLRLLLPFGPEVSLLGKTYQAVDQAITQAAPLPPPAVNTPKDILEPAAGLEQNHETVSPPAEDLTTAPPLQEIGVLLANHVWLIWLGAALGLLIRKVTIYQGFMRYIKAGLTPVSDLAVLDRLSITAERAGVQKPVELCVNPLISSPLLMGFFRPCIVLPSADISEMVNFSAAEARAFGMKASLPFFKLMNMRQVTIAAVNGFALGGGCEISMACDIRIASDNASFAQPECGLGIIPGFGGTQRLARLVGMGRAKELIFTCDSIDANEAYRIGLVNKVVAKEELMPTAQAMAKKIISKGSYAVAIAKAAINNGYDMDIQNAVEMEANLFGITCSTQDKKEGMTAFLEKRKADLTDF